MPTREFGSTRFLLIGVAKVVVFVVWLIAAIAFSTFCTGCKDLLGRIPTNKTIKDTNFSFSNAVCTPLIPLFSLIPVSVPPGKRDEGPRLSLFCVGHVSVSFEGKSKPNHTQQKKKVCRMMHSIPLC